MNAFAFDEPFPGVGRLTFDLPGEKVNKFSAAVIAELDETLARLEARSDLRALLIRSGKPNIFIAGADLDEFHGLDTREKAIKMVRDGQKAFDRLAALPFPTLAAIGGACVGGGCELAMACDRRLMTDRAEARIGLPEIMLGIFPGWGGTHRMTRLVGLSAALDVILAGKTIPGRKAKSIGLVDELVPHAILDARALEVAKEMATKPKLRREPGHGRGLAGWFLDATPPGRSLVFSMATKAVRKKTGGHYPAPLAALDSVRRGLADGIARGQETDAERLADLAEGPVVRNLVDIFFWSERAKKDSGLAAGREAEPLPADSLGVLGAGVMGGGIAQLAAEKGFPSGDEVGAPGVARVRLKDIDAKALTIGLKSADGLWRKDVKRKKLAERERPYRLAAIAPTLTWQGFGSIDVTIEAVIEKLAVKRAVLAEWEGVAREDAIFASNTSTLPITDIAADARHPERVIGMHFFNPVHRMPLVEVIPGAKTSDRAIRTIVELAKAWGKTPVVVADRPGFLVNRILGTYLNEAVRMLEEGADADAVDRAGLAFGLPMGPLTLLDEVGVDVAAKAGDVLLAAFGDRMTGAKGIAAMAAAGRVGKKANRGFFRYANGRRVGIDPEAIAVVRAAGAAGAGAASPADITDRLILPMVKESVICLDEGVAPSAEKLDLAMIFGIGFPPFRGGVLRHADAVGADALVKRFEQLAARHGASFVPPAGLVERARSGRRFHS